MPSLTRLSAQDATNVFSMTFVNGQVWAISGQSYNGWLAAHKSATTADAEAQILSFLAANPPSGAIGTVATVPALDTGTLSCVQCRGTTDHTLDVDVYVHVLALSPADAAMIVVSPGTRLRSTWWQP